MVNNFVRSSHDNGTRWWFFQCGFQDLGSHPGHGNPVLNLTIMIHFHKLTSTEAVIILEVVHNRVHTKYRVGRSGDNLFYACEGRDLRDSRKGRTWI